ncbi:MAG TPA: SUMF1/EgtB/PvdO family nonheme iron enzyme [Candidatus Cloacimonadota bacterium]|nr:SUMF1/EgtB/PvdO family nonheme iron enzyme [Candidatus Cloacimonadota bacterium]
MVVFILLITLLLALTCFTKKEPDNMVLVEGGTFEMGTDDVEKSDYYVHVLEPSEPLHSVTLSSFYIGKYPVMQKEWQAVMGNNPSKNKGDNLPVGNVSWFDVVEYCNKLSEKEGLTPAYTINEEDVTCDWSANGYRLPTEAEWEYAARGGKESKGYDYSGSNNVDDVAWHQRNSDMKTHDVGTKDPNELGIYDMSGNVFEWCWDRYEAEYYSESPESDPNGPDNGAGRVIRGGSCYNTYVDCLVVYRSSESEYYRHNSELGFRVVRTM